ncbi:MAG: pantetheine-phosphate adenylyltransferase [Odoribacter sp.]|nr:pantetheine-phosphate adenylyltransferase [Odoribacter sp.]MDY3034014.1 pantetheine-phosphate adenylyltransferase [Odoribacter sp.]
MERIAVFPGSFDPFTVGHEEIVRRALKLFDKIIIAVGINPGKREFLSTESRIKLIQKAFEDTDRVSVEPYSGLTVDFCQQVNSHIIIRGLRTAADFEYERAIGQANRAMDGDIETVFILTSTVHTFVSSTIVRNIYMNGGDVTKFLPERLTTEDLRHCEEL